MAQFYFDPRRESDPQALPDGEVFYHNCTDSTEPCPMESDEQLAPYQCYGVGWYWQACYPGCLPDGDPEGPFDTGAEALADAQSDVMLSDPDDDTGDDSRIGKLHTSAAACIARIENGASLNDALSWLDEEIDEIMSGGDPHDENRDADDLPLCARYMGCLCAGHARGNPADQACDTSEKGD